MSVRVGIVGSDERAREGLVRALDAAPPEWRLTLHDAAPTEIDAIVCDPGLDIPGAIVVDPDEPSGAISSIAARIATGGRAVLVTSPSGGTGVTSLVIHLAAAIARFGANVCVLDLDGSWGVAARLGVADEAGSGGPVPVAGGFRLLRGAASLDRARAEHDFVLIDAHLETVPTVADRVTDALLVVAPTPEGARRARHVLDQNPSFVWSVVANRLGPGGETTCSALARSLDTGVAELPCCAALRDAEDDHRLIAAGWTRWGRRVARIAREIASDR